MKKIFTSIAFLAGMATAQAQTTAPNWTSTDCNGTSHTLYNILDSNIVVVFTWVMPCPSCINGAKAAYNAVKSYSATHPGKVKFYLADDLGDDACSALTSWVTSNNIGDVNKIHFFENGFSEIDENNFGGSGMPHTVVIAGNDRKIYFNKKNPSTNDPVGLTTAINDALATLSVEEAAKQAAFSITPNPVRDAFTVKYTKAIKSVSITSISGQVVKNELFTESKMNPSVSMKGLPSGIYTIKLIDEAGNTGLQKLVKE